MNRPARASKSRAAKFCNCDEIARGGGTTIAVRDLFFNVPARKKFLRSEQTELAHIASLVTHYSLAHPDKTFELWNGGATLLHATPVETLRERVFQVFGSQLLEDLIELETRTRHAADAGTGRTAEDLYGARFRFAPAGAEEQSELDFRFRERPADSRPTDAACAFERLSQSDAAGVLSVRAAVSRLRLRRGGRECASVEDGSAVPASIVGARFCARCGAGTVDAVAARAVVQPGAAAGGGALPYSDFSQMLQNETAGASLPATVPEYTLHPTAPPAGRFDFGNGAIAVNAAELKEEPLQLRVPDTHGGFPGGHVPRRTQHDARHDTANCGRWGNCTTASSSRRAATGSGSSISMWRTSAFCSSRCCRSRPRGASKCSIC